MTRKRLPSLALGNNFHEMNAEQLPVVTATPGGCGDCWKPRWVAGDACDMTENDPSILIVVFPHNSNKPRPQTESCLFSDRHQQKVLFINNRLAGGDIYFAAIRY